MVHEEEPSDADYPQATTALLSHTPVPVKAGGLGYVLRAACEARRCARMNVDMDMDMMLRVGWLTWRGGGGSFITGVILTDKMANFERLVFRGLRGNMFMKHADVDEPITDPITGDLVKKTAFIIFFSGERSRAKVKKICESFHANVYPCPENPSEREALQVQLETKLDDMRRVLSTTTEHRITVLSKIALQCEAWSRKVKKEKAVFHTLNMFNYDITRKALLAEGWCPVSEQDRVHRALQRGTVRYHLAGG